MGNLAGEVEPPCIRSSMKKCMKSPTIRVSETPVGIQWIFGGSQLISVEPWATSLPSPRVVDVGWILGGSFAGGQTENPKSYFFRATNWQNLSFGE